MLVQLESVLDQEQLAVASDLLTQSEFLAGEASAGALARKEKHNLEMSDSDQRKKKLDNLVMGALLRHPAYLNAGLPHKVAAPYFARYQNGMHYGWHVDNPVMGQGDVYRADVAITLFLNEPDEYDGGELEIQTSVGSELIKYKAGFGVMYPASYRHQVKEVTRGERRVAVTWMQSLVADASKRELLYHLFLAKQQMMEICDQSKEVQLPTSLVDQSYCNLIRMWSQT